MVQRRGTQFLLAALFVSDDLNSLKGSMANQKHCTLETKILIELKPLICR